MDPEYYFENGTVLRTEESQAMDGDLTIYYYMACGPFETWEAVKVE